VDGELIVDNNGQVTTGWSTPLTNTASVSLDDLIIKGKARVQLGAGLTVRHGVTFQDGYLRIPPSSVLTVCADVWRLTGNQQMVVEGEVRFGGQVQPDALPRMEIASGSPISFAAGSRISYDDMAVLAGGMLSFDGPVALVNLRVGNGGLVTHSSTATGLDLNLLGGLTVEAGGSITHLAGSSGLNLTTLGDLTVKAGGVITADAKGYGSAAGPGKGASGGSGGGGGYGGTGGNGGGGVAGGSTYGSETEPVDLGSGGGTGSGASGAGGGAIRLTVGGTMTLDGQVTANGGASGGYGGGGSGGSVYATIGFLTGTGLMSANGGWGGTASGGGGGGGGRVAIYTNCEPDFGQDQVRVDGGNGMNRGQPGTIFWAIWPDILPNQCVNRLYVNATATGANNGSSWTDAFTDLQAALNAAKTLGGNCTEVWVAEGIYRPSTRTDFDDPRSATFHLNDGLQLYGGFAGTETSRLQRNPSARSTLSGDLNGDDDVGQLEDNSYHVLTTSEWETTVVVDGFAITAGNAGGANPLGGGLTSQDARLALINDTILGNQGPAGGSACLMACVGLTIDNLTIGLNGPGLNAAITDNILVLNGRLQLATGTLELQASVLEGPGSLDLAQGTSIRVGGNAVRTQPQQLIECLQGNTGSTGFTWTTTEVRSRITGRGDIDIDADQRLVLSGQANLNLSGLPDTECANDPGAPPTGKVTVNGSLVVKDAATVHNTNVEVKLLSFDGQNTVQHNNITLRQVLPGYGGEFFVSDAATVSCNRIISYGDRYLDLDPDPRALARPTVTDNRFFVRIAEGVAGDQGTMLELRTRDFDCPGGCSSGALPLPAGLGYSDAWVLEELEVLPNAKVNLTNRPGFVFQDPAIPVPEVLYVKKVILHPNAVLNTGLQRMYYQQLVDESGVPLVQDSTNPAAPMSNGSRIVDIPLLGFSLGIIAMDDQSPSPFNEQDIRIRKRLTDPQDEQAESGAPQQGAVSHLPEARGPNNGVLELRTQAEGMASASSVAAKGSFARAGEENIVVAFEYQYLGGGDAQDAELIVSLSDNAEVGQGNYEVVRVRPPVAGVPGSIGNGTYAVFYQVVPYEDWSAHLGRFNRGTYVELELRGKGAIVRIDNWDPQVTCRYECASYDNIPGVTEADFLILLAEYGRALNPGGDAKDCLDIALNRDKYVDLSDLLGWDSLRAGNLNSCGTGGASAAPLRSELARDGSSWTSFKPLLISGKSNESGRQQDVLYGIAGDGTCTASTVPPAGGTNSHGNGRLVRDSQGKAYQVHGTRGLVRLSDGQVMVGPRNDLASGNNTVAVSVTATGGGSFTGLPLLDAAFDPADPTVVYVTPVLVMVPSPAHAYRATARLVLDPAHPGTYSVGRLYGVDPWTDSSVNTTMPDASSCNVQRLREVEIDRSGKSLYVSSAQGGNDNEWLLIYDVQTGAETRQRLTQIHTELRSPVAMLVSAREDSLYLASSATGGNDRIFRLGISGTSLRFDGELVLDDVGQITAMTEDPITGKLYVAGFQSPEIPENLSRTDPLYTQYFSNNSAVFTAPRILAVQPAATWTSSIAESPSLGATNLGLPLAAIYLPGPAADLDRDGDADSADLDLFRACVSGPTIPRADTLFCQLADFDHDSDVDQSDFGRFQRCFSGTGGQPNLNCAN